MSKQHPVKPRRRQWFILRVEELETRLAPAAMINSTTLRFTDVDSDLVTVQFSKPLLTAANVGSVFTFNSPLGDVGPQQLQEINLTGLAAAAANGVSISITAVPTAT